MSSARWDRPGVPHKGWRCVDMIDCGEPDETCQMCGQEDIRYLHAMRHPEVARTLLVGCVCAGHMEEDYVRARKRQAAAVARAGRRKRWLQRNWRETVDFRGTRHELRAGPFCVRVREVGPDEWQAMFSDEPQEAWYVAVEDGSGRARRFASIADAKLSLFDTLFPSRSVVEEGPCNSRTETQVAVAGNARAPIVSPTEAL